MDDEKKEVDDSPGTSMSQSLENPVTDPALNSDDVDINTLSNSCVDEENKMDKELEIRLDEDSENSTQMTTDKRSVRGDYKRPFELGWKRELVYRTILTNTEGVSPKRADVYYYAPNKKKLRSYREVETYLSKMEISDLNIKCFTFTKNLIHEPPNEMVRKAKQRIIKSQNSPDQEEKEVHIKEKSACFTKSKRPVKVPRKLADEEIASRSRKETPSPSKQSKNSNSEELLTEDSTMESGVRCSLNCPGEEGVMPSLHCGVCLCLFHPSCVGFTKCNKPLFICQECLGKIKTKSSQKRSREDIGKSMNCKVKIKKLYRFSDNLNKSLEANDKKLVIKTEPKDLKIEPCDLISNSNKNQNLNMQIGSTTISFAKPIKEELTLTPKLNLGTNIIPKPLEIRPAMSKPTELVVVTPQMPQQVFQVGNLLPQVTTVNGTPQSTFLIRVPAPGTINSSPSCIGNIQYVMNSPNMPRMVQVVRTPPVVRLEQVNQPQVPTKPGTPVVLLPKEMPTTSSTKIVVPNGSDVNVNNSVTVELNGGSNIAAVLKNVLSNKLNSPTSTNVETSSPTSNPGSIPLKQAVNNSSSNSGYQAPSILRSSLQPENKDKLHNTQSKESSFVKKRHTKRCYFQQLNAGFDSLLHIFKYLNVGDLLRVAKVCHTWKNASAHPSLWKFMTLKNTRVKNWDSFAHCLKKFNTTRLDLRGMLHFEDKNRTWHGFAAVLKELESLKHIDFGEVPTSIVHTITKYLIELQIFTAEEIIDGSKEAEAWSNACRLDIGMFGQLKKLKKLRIRGIHGINLPTFSISGGMANLKSLTALEHLSLTSMKEVPGDEFEFIKYLENLSTLAVGDCSNWSEETYQYLVNLKTLKRLRLEAGGTIDCDNLSIGSSLQNLQRLEFLEFILFDIPNNIGSSLKGLTSLQEIVFWTNVEKNAAQNNANVLSAVEMVSTLKHLTWGVVLPKTEFDKSTSAANSFKLDQYSKCIPFLTSTLIASKLMGTEEVNSENMNEIQNVSPNMLMTRLRTILPSTRVRVVVSPSVAAVPSWFSVR